MNKTKILYWVITGLFSAFMLFTAVPDIVSNPDAIKFMNHLGYPNYFIPFIGVAKLLGAIAILIPGFPRIKEWAYAGFVFDISGAIYSGIAVGDAAGKWMPLFIGLILIACSYVLYHKKLKLTSLSIAK